MIVTVCYRRVIQIYRGVNIYFSQIYRSVIIHLLMVLLVDSSTNLEEDEEKKNPVKLVLISITSGVLVSAFINGGIHLIARRKRRGNKLTSLVDCNNEIYYSCSNFKH